MALLMDLRVESEDWQKLASLEAICLRALETGLLVDASAPKNTNVDILLTDDTQMEHLNALWRGKPKPTDVLSFPAEDSPDGFLGDIAIGYGLVARDAAQGDKTLPNHLSHLLIHGLLHLLGYDHIEDDEAEIMENLERAALAKLGISDPYSRIIEK